MSLVVGVVVVAWFLSRQVTARPLSGGYTLPLILAVIGLLEFGAFLMGGGQQLASFLKGHRSFAVAVPDGRTILVAVAGSLALAVVSAAIRAPTVRLWWQDGQCWRKGTWITLALWIVSLGAHLGYDALIAHSTRQAGVGNSTLLLFFAVSLTVQRVMLGVRARRATYSAPGDDTRSWGSRRRSSADRRGS
jgi:hypothetical protein